MRDRRPILFVFPLCCALGLAAPAQSPPDRVSPSPTAIPSIGGKTLDEWIKLIDDRDPCVRENAIRMVGLLGPAAKKAVPALTRQLASPNDLSPMTCAAIAIGQILPDDPVHVKAATTGLIQLLSSSQAIVRYQAATALGNLGPGARNAVPKLAALIKDPASWELRKAAAFALGRVGVDESNLPEMKALVALADGIDDMSREVRVESLQGLINLGPPASQQDQQALRTMLEKRIRVDKDKFAAIWVRVALVRLNFGPNAPSSEPYINYIGKQLKSTESGLSADAARALGAIGPLAKAKIPDLMEAIKSSDIALTVAAAWALGCMGSDAKVAIPSLTLLVESADPTVKSVAQEAIKNINSPPRR